MIDDIPRVESLDNLQAVCDHSTYDNGNLRFLYSTFAFIKDHAVYFGRSPNTRYSLTLQTVAECLKRVPDDDVYPEAPSHITRITKATSGFFIKGPSLSFYQELEGSGQIAKVLLQEAEVLELLKHNPHPNVIRYHGCLVHRGRIVGLALERYSCTLEEYLRNCSHDIDVISGFNGIKAGVEHLHSLGFAHNDIKPSNVMIDADNAWILIDVGSCRPIGEDLIIAGDPEWTTSSKQHDEDAMNRLRDWLVNYKSE